MKRYLLLLILFLGLGITQVRAQLLVLKTDVLWDAAMTPNLGLELVTGERTSLGLSVYGNKNPWGKDMHLIAAMPEFRYWFSGRPIYRQFVGIAAIASNYDIIWGKKIFKGDAIGGGLTFGYAFHLAPRWSLECCASIGAVYYQMHRGYTTDIATDVKQKSRGYALIPFKIGVSFSYIIK